MEKVKFKDAPWWDARFEFFGNEEMPLLIIDNFFPEPSILLEDASQKTFVSNSPYYPGVRAAVPSAYFRPLTKGLSDALMNIFQYPAGVDVKECHYSLTTEIGANLNMVQRLPHVDGGNDMKIALLHYLCSPEHGGTSFYRQARTGFETVSNSRYSDYNDAVEADHAEKGPPAAQYYNGTDGRFEKITAIEAKFNRAVLYFGVCLHSVDIGDESHLTSNPLTGRITINTFITPI